MIFNKTIQFVLLFGAAALVPSVQSEIPENSAPKLYPAIKPCCDKDDFPQCFIGDAKCCRDGTWVCPNGKDGTYTCPGDSRSYTRGAVKTSSSLSPPGQPCDVVKQCTDDVFQCPDGSYVPRDPKRDCAFRPCPPSGVEACPEGVFRCGDGSVLSRDPDNNCNFPPCPLAPPSLGKKCDPAQFPLCFIGTAKCCPDGTWRCPNGNTGTYNNCGEDDTMTTSSVRKQCGRGCEKGELKEDFDSP